MTAQFDNESHFAEWNEAMARKYDPEAYHLHSNFLIRWIERRRVQAILRFLDATPQDEVLEVGCGAGNILEQIPSRQLHGVDLSTFLLEKSQRRLFHFQAKLIRANAEHLPFANGRFHKLVCSEVLEHVADPDQVVNEMARIATKDAVIVISVPNEPWIDRIKGIVRNLGLGRWLMQGNGDSYSSPNKMTDEWHLHSFDLAFLHKISQNVLHIQEIRTIPFSFLPLRYVARCQVVWPK